MPTPLACLLLLALPHARAAEGDPSISFTDSGLKLAVPERNASLALDLLAQPQAVATLSGDPDATDADRWSGSGLRMRRMLLLASGDISKRVSYKFRINVASTQTFTDADGKSRMVSKPTLDDGYMDIKLAGPVKITVGHFKVPWSAQWQTGVTRQAFWERPLATEGLSYGDVKLTGPTPGRDTGAMVHAEHLDKRLDWSLGVFEGEGGMAWPATDMGLLYAARVSFAPLGAYKLDEYHISRGDPRLGLGLSAYRNDAPTYGDAGAYRGTVRSDSFGAELRFAAEGIQVAGEYFRGLALDAEQDMADGAWSQSWYAMATYVPAKLPLYPGVRVSGLDPSTEAEDDALLQAHASLSWCLPTPQGYAGKEWGERHRLQVQYGLTQGQGAEHPLAHEVLAGMVLAL
ncbi:MAG: porin [Pseudomonadota bacterium]